MVKISDFRSINEASESVFQKRNEKLQYLAARLKELNQELFQLGSILISHSLGVCDKRQIVPFVILF